MSKSVEPLEKSAIPVQCSAAVFGASAENPFSRWDRAEAEGRLFEDVPANHSAFFAPVVQPTLRVGFKALCIAALTFLEGN